MITDSTYVYTKSESNNDIKQNDDLPVGARIVDHLNLRYNSKVIIADEEAEEILLETIAPRLLLSLIHI